MKYKHQPTRKQINDLRIDIKKDNEGNIKGFTIWSGHHWVLDGSVLKDEDESFCRIYLSGGIHELQFEYFNTFLELRSKNKQS